MRDGGSACLRRRAHRISTTSGDSNDAGAALLLDDVSAKLRNELQAIHDRWFQEFDAGEGAAMDAVEVDNLVLVMPDGSVWKKSGSRAGKQPKRDVMPQRPQRRDSAPVRRYRSPSRDSDEQDC